ALLQFRGLLKSEAYPWQLDSVTPYTASKERVMRTRSVPKEMRNHLLLRKSHNLCNLLSQVRIPALPPTKVDAMVSGEFRDRMCIEDH
ncbi:mCG141265, partial [Mus musculus]